MVSDESISAAIAQHHLFSSLGDTRLNKLMAGASQTGLNAGDILCHQGDQANRFFFVISGQIRLYRMAPSGHEKVVDVVRAGNCFAEALMFSAQKSYPVTSEAIVDAQVIGFDNRSFLALLKEDNDLCIALMNQMSHRLHSQIIEIENLSLQNATHRLVNFLLRKLQAPESSLELDVPKRLLASQLSIQPETLSRILRKLSDAKIISVDNKKLHLLDKQKLLDLAADNQPLRSS